MGSITIYTLITFFTCCLLLGLLREKTYAASTVRANRKQLSEAFKKRKVKQGEHQVYQKDGLVATVWHDKRDVLLSSSNTSHTMDQVERWDRRLRRKVVVPCPAVVKLYNKSMGGVDKADRMRGYYSTIKCRSAENTGGTC